MSGLGWPETKVAGTFILTRRCLRQVAARWDAMGVETGVVADMKVPETFFP
jgi:hypothetical protein